MNKKIAAILLGMSLVVGAATAVASDDHGKDKDHKSGDKKHKDDKKKQH